MKKREVVTHERWLQERLILLNKEKELQEEGMNSPVNVSNCLRLKLKKNIHSKVRTVLLL